MDILEGFPGHCDRTASVPAQRARLKEGEPEGGEKCKRSTSENCEYCRRRALLCWGRRSHFGACFNRHPQRRFSRRPRLLGPVIDTISYRYRVPVPVLYCYHCTNTERRACEFDGDGPVRQACPGSQALRVKCKALYIDVKGFALCPVIFCACRRVSYNAPCVLPYCMNYI
jgi:hypothetical protein